MLYTRLHGVIVNSAAPVARLTRAASQRDLACFDAASAEIQQIYKEITNFRRCSRFC